MENKQTKEIADIIRENYLPVSSSSTDRETVAYRLAELLYKAGYTKQALGKWKLNPDGSGTCNQCGFTQVCVWDYDSAQSYCGVCGANMCI